MTAPFAVTGGRIFDGDAILTGHALVVEGATIRAIVEEDALPADLARLEAEGALVAPGFVDLQVNGGGGVLFNNCPTRDGIATICEAHARFGTTALMVTLITDRVAVRDEALTAGATAHAEHLPGYLGLHLEGPHLSIARKGTHDPALIRPMDEEDLSALVAAVGTFGHALTTIAPENVNPEQVRALCAAGYVVSLGHTDVAAAEVADYVEAGASMVTHLFNAMSQMGNREPGLVGAALSFGALFCGLIADGFHVDPTSMGIALRAKAGPGQIFLVTDAMSTIGTDDTGFDLNGRHVFRRDGRLSLADGTLAGADIDMLSCVRFAHTRLGLPVPQALNMASLYPAQAIGAADRGRLSPGMRADFILLDKDLSLVSTYIGGHCVHGAGMGAKP
ncbi:N-acetylglucosamine-6-phosphate deacetylase [Rhizobium sp. FY34]|uniref:N-acetylglucosamine-6-phosphate deacetylase n=1 Tax=Rhizobium sp. FY34 TaxID=2562309 RepID=UPI0010BFA252|nr:N-acetylglucosamine-6-phosphate deacetylase [Rhizobium sp. FY34]